ncbi:MAG: alpha-glucan family phosphorylase [Gammaproteobacteria bacterium]|nr:alpha-glucan family phosphorylase [Gammaproteobacteria bacterium]
MAGTFFTLEVQPEIPKRLARLEELANDLYYSWDRHSRGLFFYLDRELWEDCRHNPKVFLRRVSQRRLEEAAVDRAFLEEFQRTLANYDTYHEEIKRLKKVHKLDADKDLIAYFCAEFGLHESLPVYSGGLGILAGDYCKAASDLGIPFVAVGLLYHQGNLTQTIGHTGYQVSHYQPVDLKDLPVQPARGSDEKEVFVSIDLPESKLLVKVWWVKTGNTNLYLLDTDVAENSEIDRAITYQIYPSDQDIRLKQEIVLGIGGARALTSMGLTPTVWHINEGHPCLQILERCRVLVEKGLEFQAALQLVAARTVFTTHTPVAAGHEVYDIELLRSYLAGFIDELNIEEQEFFALGKNDHQQGFNLTTFSIRCSRFHNGVSQIHRQVAAEMEQKVWPEVPVEENPMGFVTNGIHVQTFMAHEWINLLDDPGWFNELLNPDYWQKIDAISDATFWSNHLLLKANLYHDCCRFIERRCRRHGYSQAQITRETEHLRSNEDALVIGFARRFATYKRATLLFDDPERLQRLLNDPERPVILIFAGKAHPNDEPGKELIKRIHEFSRQAEFQGKVLLLEGYDLALGRKLVTGVDLWLNTPEYPLEACGTSGMKAGINGVINLSTMDGWWAEGYNKKNGWALQPHDSEMDLQRRRWLENRELMDVLEQEIVPMYFDKTQGYSERWVRMAKESMKSIIPRFNAQRMVMDYVNQYYIPAITTAAKLEKGQAANAKLLADWKQTINKQWPGLSIRRLDNSFASIKQGKEMTLRVGVHLNGLVSDDVNVECLFSRATDTDEFETISCHILEAVDKNKDETIYEIRFTPDLSGLIAYKLRAYPYHRFLCHHFEMGFMKWV